MPGPSTKRTALAATPTTSTLASATATAYASSSRAPDGQPPAKRARPSDVSDGYPASSAGDVDGDEEDEGEGGHVLGEGNSEADKAARKEARTIRNRESAQRSRNQRKAHLAHLEQRVAELEAENRRLRGETETESESGSTASSSPSAAGTTAPPPAPAPKTMSREPSPALSVLSLANDLGIPSEIVTSSGSGGVNLASVAPPPRGLEMEPGNIFNSGLGSDSDEDIKPIIPTVAPRAVATLSGDALQRENAALRERIVLLEHLVKQVVAVSNLGGISSASASFVASGSSALAASRPEQHQQTISPAYEPVPPTPTLDWDALLVPAPTMTDHLYPSVPANISSTSTSSLPIPIPTSSSAPTPPTQDPAHNTLARHPAVVATSCLPPVSSHETAARGAQQRARKHVIVRSEMDSVVVDSARTGMGMGLGAGTGTGTGLVEASGFRLRQAARVVLALAKLRGWTAALPVSGSGLDSICGRTPLGLDLTRAKMARRAQRGVRVRRARQRTRSGSGAAAWSWTRAG